MKVVYCFDCGDIRAPDPEGGVTFCLCGRTGFKWEDPVRGTLAVSNALRRARVIGMHNGMLRKSAEPLGEGWHTSSEEWREVHEQVTSTADGYLFHTDRRNCWAVIIAPGESNDTRWVKRDELPLLEAS